MTPRVRYGLIAGAAGLVLNSCVSALLGICGPLVALLAGAVAGFLTAREEQAPAQRAGARAGALSGLIAGALVLVGQLIGVSATLTLTQVAEIEPIIGTLPEASDTVGQTFFWLGGLGIAVCFGLVGLALSAGSGAAAGYLVTPSQTDLPLSG